VKSVRRLSRCVVSGARLWPRPAVRPMERGHHRASNINVRRHARGSTQRAGRDCTGILEVLDKQRHVPTSAWLPKGKHCEGNEKACRLERRPGFIAGSDDNSMGERSVVAIARTRNHADALKPPPNRCDTVLAIAFLSCPETRARQIEAGYS
jgi:hypothetical protein